MVILRPKEKADIIEDIVCRYYEFNKSDMYEKTRKRRIVRVRQILHYLLKTHTALALREIGEMSADKNNYKNHATILHSVNTVTNELLFDAELQKEIDYLQKVIVKKIKPRHSKTMLELRMKLIRVMRTSKNEDILKAELINLL
jgi:chromosomal replication initiator protein